MKEKSEERERIERLKLSEIMRKVERKVKKKEVGK